MVSNIKDIFDIDHLLGPADETELNTAKSFYEKNGWLICDSKKLKSSLDRVRKEISYIIQRVLKDNQIEIAPNHQDFDSGLQHLISKNRSLGGIVYDATGRLLSMHQISVHKTITRLARLLLSSNHLQAAFDKAVRIDYPQEDRFLFPWHQDYTYDPSSPGGLVYWIPLKNVREENGSIEIASGSHKRGIRKVRVVNESNEKSSGSKLYEIEDLSDIEKASRFFAELDYGQFIIFNNLLLHRSGANQSKATRWTIQIRYGDFENDFAASKGWPNGSFRNKWFYLTHPEFIAK